MFYNEKESEDVSTGGVQTVQACHSPTGNQRRGNRRVQLVPLQAATGRSLACAKTSMCPLDVNLIQAVDLISYISGMVRLFLNTDQRTRRENSASGLAETPLTINNLKLYCWCNFTTIRNVDEKQLYSLCQYQKQIGAY